MRIIGLQISFFMLFYFSSCERAGKKSSPRKIQPKAVIQLTTHVHPPVKKNKRHVPIIPAVVSFVRADPDPIPYYWGEPPVTCPTMDPIDIKIDSIFDIAAVMPEFPGGQEALKIFLSNNLVYPEDAKEIGIEGKVIVSFVVFEDGSIQQGTILRGISGMKSCEREALRLIKLMPKWTSGKNELGRTLKVRVRIPVVFSLD